jgi:hypothetical protein
MQRKSWIITAALIAGLALGIVFGPSVRGLSAYAQTPSPSASPSSSASASASPKNMLRSLFLDKLAAALNIDRTALDSAIVTAGNGTADEAVANGTLTQAQADARFERIQAGDYGFFGGGRGGKSGHGGFGGGVRVDGLQDAVLTAVTTTLNLTQEELITQLRSGQTLDQIATAQGTTTQRVTDAALAAAKTQLDQAVANGSVTQAQADAIYARLQEQGSQFLLRGGRGFGHHGGPHGDSDEKGTPDVPQTSPSVSPNA